MSSLPYAENLRRFCMEHAENMMCDPEGIIQYPYLVPGSKLLNEVATAPTDERFVCIVEGKNILSAGRVSPAIFLIVNGQEIKNIKEDMYLCRVVKCGA